MLPFLEDEEVAMHVVEEIGRLGTGAVNSTIEALSQANIDNPNIPVMENIIKILGNLKNDCALDMLEKISQHPNVRIRDAVDDSLTKIKVF